MIYRHNKIKIIPSAKLNLTIYNIIYINYKQKVILNFFVCIYYYIFILYVGMASL